MSLDSATHWDQVMTSVCSWIVRSTDFLTMSALKVALVFTWIEIPRIHTLSMLLLQSHRRERARSIRDCLSSVPSSPSSVLLINTALNLVGCALFEGFTKILTTIFQDVKRISAPSKVASSSDWMPR